MLTLTWILTSFWSSWASVCESSHHLVRGGCIHTVSANKEKEAAKTVTFPRTQSIRGRRALRFLICLRGWNTVPNGLPHSHIQILYRHSRLYLSAQSPYETCSVILLGRQKQNFRNVVCMFPDVGDNIASPPLPNPSYQRVSSLSQSYA